ncbi:MAG: chloride channel protein, partial [Aestuariivirga sp.]
MATTIGAIALGIIAIGFAWLADAAAKQFSILFATYRYAPLLVTPLGLGLIVWVTRRFAPNARGSGIPQVIAGSDDPKHAVQVGLISAPTAMFKMLATAAALLVGASVGREGPTVQVSAAIMAFTHRILRIELSTAVVIAGGAAGISAAFNTPLAGVAFAIEELAASYHQRLALLAMASVMISGLVSLGLAGDYLYFGAVHEVLSLKDSLFVSLVAGVVGGFSGGVFSLAIIKFGTTNAKFFVRLHAYPIRFAMGCGLLIAIIGIATKGATWGAGYDTAKM